MELPEPVYDFWHTDLAEHTFHLDGPWQGEEKRNIQFYAYRDQQANTEPVYDFWDSVNKQHTFHLDDPWPGEEKKNVQFYAYRDQQPGTQPVYDFWQDEFKQHSFHLGDPWWDGEAKGDIQFYAYPKVQEKEMAEGGQQAEDVAALEPAAKKAKTVPAEVRAKRWSEGLDAPAAGRRNFTPHGYTVKLQVSDAIAVFGKTAYAVANIMAAGKTKASTSRIPISDDHAAAIYAYTEESPLYGTLNYTMRTPHTALTPTDDDLIRYADYIIHLERALSTLPTHVSSIHGKVYRGINVLLDPELYAPGSSITWQGFSSATRKQITTVGFVQSLPSRQLQGSVFVIDAIIAKSIRHFSALPGEEEVLFPPNSQFQVERVLKDKDEKKAMLSQLGAYDLTDLDVYVMKQVA